MNIFYIQRYNFKRRFVGGFEGSEEWESLGYTEDKLKTEEIIKNSKEIEIFDHFGESFIPKKIIKEFRVIELKEI